MCYAENLQSAEEYQQLRSKLSSTTPMILAQVQALGNTSQQPAQKLWTSEEIGCMGFEMALWGVSGLQATVAVLEQVASEILEAGGIVSTTPLASLDQVKDVVGFSELDEFEEEYGCI